MQLEPHRLVFIGETGTTTKMIRLRGRCLKSQRLRAKGTHPAKTTGAVFETELRFRLNEGLRLRL